MKINESLVKAYGILKEREIDTYMLDSQVILGHVIKADRLYLTLNRDEEISREHEEEFFRLIQERSNRKPVKYIIKECEFMGLDYYVEEGVLIPRPDTEILVEECLKNIDDKRYERICDVCCGSGAIGLSVAALSEVKEVDLFDISEIALKVTGVNIEKLGVGNKVEVAYSDLLQKAIEEEKVYDCVISNPPYIQTHVIDELMEDVRDYEPHLALDGGEDGLIFYREITAQCQKVLKAGGMLAFEIGHDQREAVRNILSENGYYDIQDFKDYGENDRVVLGFKKEQKI